MANVQITDAPPQLVAEELQSLRDVLDAQLPPKALDRNLLIATWNLRMFGGLTKKWVADEDDSPKRDFAAVRIIAEILSRFDVVAVQEVRGELRALRHLLKILGPAWSFVLTDVTRGSKGNDERMAYLFDTRKVAMSGLACELVLPEEELGMPGALQRQFARTPYAVSFRANRETFVLVTLHVLFGESAQDRLPELQAIADWLADWAREMDGYGHNLIALGDFNIDRKGNALFDAFTSTGLEVPADLHTVPRSIFDDPEDPLDKFYDQIAWFTGAKGLPALSLKYLRGGSFDFVPHSLPSRNLSKQALSFRVSDHYPLWVELEVR